MPMTRDRAGTRRRQCARRVQKIPANATLPPLFALAPPVTRLAHGRRVVASRPQGARRAPPCQPEPASLRTTAPPAWPPARGLRSRLRRQLAVGRGRGRNRRPKPAPVLRTRAIASRAPPRRRAKSRATALSRSANAVRARRPLAKNYRNRHFPPLPPSAGKAGSWLQRLRRQPPRVLPGCHAACPRCGLHNAALRATARCGRTLPTPAAVRSLRSPRNWRYANLAPATGAPACAGALNGRLWCATSAKVSRTNSGRAMCHRASCALRLPWSSVGALRAPTPGTFPRPPGGAACGGSHCVARSRLGSTAAHPPHGAPQTGKQHHSGTRRKSPDKAGSLAQQAFASGLTTMQNAPCTAIRPFASLDFSRRTAP